MSNKYYKKILNSNFIENYATTYVEFYNELQHINLTFELLKNIEQHLHKLASSKFDDEAGLLISLGKPYYFYLPTAIYRFVLEEQNTKSKEIYNLKVFFNEVLENITDNSFKNEIQTKSTEILRKLNTSKGFAKKLSLTRNKFVGHRLKDYYKPQPSEDIFDIAKMEELLNYVNELFKLISFSGIEQQFLFRRDYNLDFKSYAESSIIKTLDNVLQNHLNLKM